MKSTTTLLFIFCCAVQAFSQVEFGPQQIISTNANKARSVLAIDVDADGDLDVLSASFDDDKIAWYENLDGKGAFGAQQVITSDADGAYSVFATDLDEDGDFDVLSASFHDGKIAWYENTDGSGTFGAPQIISYTADGATSVHAVDLNGDGHMDVLSSFNHSVAWYEHLDGMGTFGDPQIIPFNQNLAKSVYAGDLDGDGDADVLAAYHYRILWVKNLDGKGAFGPAQIITMNHYAELTDAIYPADIDNDGDLDILTDPYDKLAWYENTDGFGQFDQVEIIAENTFSSSVYAADLDSDGDLDVLSTERLEDTIAWYENLDGFGNFGAKQIITLDANEPHSVFAADLDGDGDLDVLSASSIDNKVAWYENRQVVSSTSDISHSNIVIYPIPTADFITIESEVPLVQIEVFNRLGQLVIKEKISPTIDLSRLPAGLYICNAKDDAGKSFIQKILKQ